MKRISTLLLVLAVCMMALAQMKLTPQAQVKIAVQKAKAEQKAAKARAQGKTYTPKQQQITLVVKVAEENAAETYRQLRAAGATIKSKIGNHAVISLPTDSVETIAKIEGVVRIDTTHKGKKKTDVTLKETGVNLIDGSTPGYTTAYTGKGVTVCVIDQGFDFQHPAFKDSEGRSRIKCVYLMNNEDGNKYSYHDAVAGDINFPGSVYDTPELIASLTTDTENEMHGTHTAGIAAGSRSPLGYSGMAPDADIILIPIPDEDNAGENPIGGEDDEEGEEGEEEEDSKVMETALSFAMAYAIEHDQKMVVSVSANSHTGPHNGTGTMPEVIKYISRYVIPVFSSGNEAFFPIHINKQFTPEDNVLRTMLQQPSILQQNVSVGGYCRSNYTESDSVTLQISLVHPESKEVLWESEAYTFSPANTGENADLHMEISLADEQLAKYFTGSMTLAGGLDEGNFGFIASVTGTMLGDEQNQNLVFTMTNNTGLNFDLWEQGFGFEHTEEEGYTNGDAEMSGGDWTTTDGVISVGAYCANTDVRNYNGEISEDNEFNKIMINLGDIAYFSSYGEYVNGVSQPTVCAPGVFVVSSWNHYAIDPENDTVLPTMQWDGFPYGAESGTSMSCPAVAGIIALWLQANPKLDFDGVMDVLKNSSVTDEFTTAAPKKWGYGKISASKGIKYIAQSAGIKGIRNDNGTQPASGAIYDLQGRRLNGKPSAGIYIQGGKKVIIR